MPAQRPSILHCIPHRRLLCVASWTALLVLTALHSAIAVAVDGEILSPAALFNSSPSAGSLSPDETQGATDPEELVTDPAETRLLRLEEELESLRAKLEANSEKGSDTSKSDKSLVPAPVKYPTTKVSGFVHLDSAWFQQDAPSRSMPTFGDLQDDRGFRRLRLSLSGKVAENISYLSEVDFAAAGRPSVFDVWGSVSDVPVLGNVRAGYWRQPFGMSELTSARDFTFMERAPMFGMAPFRQIGVGFNDLTDDENVTWAASVFGTATDAYGDSIGDRGYGGAARITAVLLEDESAEFLIHGGLDYAWLATPNKQFQIRNFPEYTGPVGVAGSVPSFVDTGTFSASDQNLFNAELASNWGPWHVQSEVRCAVADTKTAGATVFPSFYIQTGYVLTGEHRTYRKSAGVFGSVSPQRPLGTRERGPGAWEVAFRYSWIDLNQGTIRGGEMANVSWGLNWYLNDNTRMLFNFIDSHLNRDPVGSSDANVFATRLQLVY